MLKKINAYIFAKKRAFIPLAVLNSPRADVFKGFKKYRWLISERKKGVLIDPSVEFRLNSAPNEVLHFEKDSWIDKGAIFWCSKEIEQNASISLGNGAYVGPYSYLGSCHQLQIGDNTLIGAHSYIITVNHRTDMPNIPIALQGFRGGDIKIGNNVWLGCHVVVLPNVKIGDGAIVGAGAVVTKNIPAGEVWGGVPAKRLK